MRAIDTFRHPIYRHNCAQAIANRWFRLYPEGHAIIDKYAPLTGGRAPAGLCGALYAAMEACPAHAAEIKAEFVDAVGAGCCRDIKSTTKTPCPVCVDTADRLVEKWACATR